MLLQLRLHLGRDMSDHHILCPLDECLTPADRHVEDRRADTVAVAESRGQTMFGLYALSQRLVLSEIARQFDKELELVIAYWCTRRNPPDHLPTTVERIRSTKH